MFLHNFKYNFICLFRNKSLIFWTFVFPILMSLFFYMAFSDIEKNETLDIIDIAIVENDNYNNTFKDAFEYLSNDNNDKKMFNIKYTNLDTAEDMLSRDKITGYLLFSEDDVSIVVNSSGINETIIRYTVSEIMMKNEIIKNLVDKKQEEKSSTDNESLDYGKIYNNAIDIINNSNVKINNISNKNLSYTMIEYYTLIAMACLYGGILSMYTINRRLPNMDSVGKRIFTSPISKLKMLLGSLLASYIVQLIGLALLFIFTIFVLNVDYGNNIIYIILLACLGALAGLSIGILVAVLFKTNDNTKTGILISIAMLGCFLSGMMGITMKYVVDKNIPVLNLVNPANMITDGFYALYYYNTPNRYLFNILSLTIFSVILISISLYNLRRQKYDSI